jgi:type VI secretion system protein ImpE
MRIEIEKPADLRDFVWAPATLTLETGAASVALIPTRYPGTERETEAALRLARATDWREQPGGAWHGVGQRMLTTNQAEIALLDVRVIAFDTELVESGADATGDATTAVDSATQADG